jgi:hypothetical protein
MSALSDRLLENFGDGVGFWELKGRLIYNGVLGLVCGYHAMHHPHRTLSTLLRWDETGNLTGFLFFAVLANVFYCAAYVPDQAFQLTPYRDGWRRWRWLLLAFGTVFGALLTYETLLSGSKAIAAVG